MTRRILKLVGWAFVLGGVFLLNEALDWYFAYPWNGWSEAMTVFVTVLLFVGAAVCFVIRGLLRKIKRLQDAIATK